jgi:seryl-tRNA synthetase
VKIVELEKKVKEVEEQLNAALRIIGNIVHNSVPVSNNEVL